MGFTPQQVDEMSAWEFQACVRGYNRANGGGDDRPARSMSDRHLADLGIEGF